MKLGSAIRNYQRFVHSSIEFQEVETLKVTMMGCVVGKLRKIDVDLAEPDYHLAIKAYQERIPVICAGDLSR